MRWLTLAEFKDLFTWDWANFFLVLGGLFVILVLGYGQLHRGDKFDLRDLILDPKTRRIDAKRARETGAWLVSTALFLYLGVHDRLTEWYFTGYMATWVASSYFNRIAEAKVDAIAKESKNG